MKNVDIKQLSLFCTLMECQSLTETARRMQVTPSAASQALARLRDIMGDPLCTRENSGYVPTPFARGALGRLREIVDMWEDLAEPAAFDPAYSDAHIVMACCETSVETALAEFFRTVTGAAPHMTIDIHSPHNGPQDLRDLREGSVELVCGSMEPPPEARDIRMETVRQYHLTHCCLSAEHPRLGQSISLAQYLAEEHIVVASLRRHQGHNDPVDAELCHHDFASRMKTVVNSWSLCAELLVRTERLATVSHAQAEQLVRANPRIKAIPLPAGFVWPTVPVNILWHERTQNSKTHRWLRTQLHDALRARRGGTASALAPASGSLPTPEAPEPVTETARPLRPAIALVARA